MKTHFHIENKEFTDYLKVTVKEKEYFFCDDLTIEYSDCDSLSVDIELIKSKEYLKIKVKNPFLKVLLNIVMWIFAPLIYFIDNDDGIGLDKGYHSFEPFTMKYSLLIESPDEKIININYIDSKYNKSTKKYTQPALKLQEDIVVKKEQIEFSPLTLKSEWNTYHVPAFTVIMIVIALLNLLNFSVFAKVIRENISYSMSENISGIVGMSFCSFIMIALLVAYTVVIVKSHKLYKCVLKENM